MSASSATRTGHNAEPSRTSQTGFGDSLGRVATGARSRSGQPVRYGERYGENRVATAKSVKSSARVEGWGMANRVPNQELGCARAPTRWASSATSAPPTWRTLRATAHDQHKHPTHHSHQPHDQRHQDDGPSKAPTRTRGLPRPVLLRRPLTEVGQTGLCLAAIPLGSDRAVGVLRLGVRGDQALIVPQPALGR